MVNDKMLFCNTLLKNLKKLKNNLMKNNLTRIVLLFSLFILANTAFAQKGSIEITGIVVETTNKQPIEFATVMIANKETKQPITGGTTAADGSFSLTSETKNFYVEISFIGYVTKNIRDISVEGGKVNLGTIVLEGNSENLGEVVVQGEKSTMEFKLDKRVFNVGKDLSSTGASALEVLNNVPSVNVDIEGAISLRGNSGVQVLINGKPSVIASEQGNALGTITADMIEKVEVITNPSAKYDAEGTSGIINIVLKKEERKGVNGSVSLNLGSPTNHSIGLSLNRRTEKFNLFTQLGAGYRALPRFNEGVSRDLVNNTAIYSDGEEYRNEQFYNFILGTDYHINETNVLTLSGRLALEIEDQPSRTDFKFEDSTGTIVSEWYRSETTEAINPKYQYELQYKSDFKDHKDHMLLFSALGNFFGKDQSSEFENINISGSDASGEQETRTNFKEAKYTFKLDYTKPFSKKFTLETGAQYVLQDVSNDYAVTDLVDGVWTPNEGLTNVFTYNQSVLGAYGTGAYEHNKFGLKIGLRAETTDLKTLLVTTNESNDRKFTNLFPSAHASYKVNKRFSLQSGYSRRIYRPRLWDLNPFFNIRNNFSIRAGNPDLLPEFTDSYEVSSIYILEKATMNVSVYQRNTTDVIERVSSFENNITTFKPMNIGTRKTTGIEFNGKFRLHKKFTLLGDFNYNYFNREGELEGTSFGFSADKWSTKWTAKTKLPAKIDFEVTGRYRSAYQTVQGTVSDQLYADLGLRKKMLKGKAVISVSVRDVFASRVRENETVQADFSTYSSGYRGRFMTLGFSYGFGKGEAMEFSGSKRRH
jgi:outer membrane receptor protein involved in Fe transport